MPSHEVFSTSGAVQTRGDSSWQQQTGTVLPERLDPIRMAQYRTDLAYVRIKARFRCVHHPDPGAKLQGESVLY
jgi:hypothetical protein